MSLDTELLYETCPDCQGQGHQPIPGGLAVICPTCNTEGLVEHEC